MIHDLKELRTRLNNLFKEIESSCAICKDCCNSYAWTIKEENADLMKNKVSLIKINDEITCINSFGSDISENKEKIKVVPTCKYYRNHKCEINNQKPLFCIFYPIMMSFKGDETTFSFDKDCKHIKEKKDLNRLTKKAEKVIKSIEPQLLRTITSQLKKVYDITEPCKEYNFEEIARIKTPDP